MDPDHFCQRLAHCLVLGLEHEDHCSVVRHVVAGRLHLTVLVAQVVDRQLLVAAAPAGCFPERSGLPELVPIS